MSNQHESQILVQKHFSEILEELITRSQRWHSASTTLRKNVKILADAEIQCAKLMRKITFPDVSFETALPAKKDEMNTFQNATAQCLQALPTKLAALHEEIAKNLMQVFSAVAVDAERQSSKAMEGMEATAVSLRGALKREQDLLQAETDRCRKLPLRSTAPATSCRWLAQVRLAWARRREREGCSTFCAKVREQVGWAKEREKEILAGLRGVLSGVVAGVAAPVSALEAGLQAMQRVARGVDADADWDAFSATSHLALLHGGPQPGTQWLPTDWREWDEDKTRWVLVDDQRGDAMSAGDSDLIKASGYLMRQGSLLSFNYHRHYFVLTADRFLHYFPSRQELEPFESVALGGRRIEAKVDKEELQLTVWPTSGGLFAPRPTRLTLKIESGKGPQTSSVSMSSGAADSEGGLEEWAAALKECSET